LEPATYFSGKLCPGEFRIVRYESSDFFKFFERKIPSTVPGHDVSGGLASTNRRSSLISQGRKDDRSSFKFYFHVFTKFRAKKGEVPKPLFYQRLKRLQKGDLQPFPVVGEGSLVGYGVRFPAGRYNPGSCWGRNRFQPCSSAYEASGILWA
jgi:hypothetical protein